MYKAIIDGESYDIIKGSYMPPYREQLLTEVQVLNKKGTYGSSNIILQDGGFGLEFIDFEIYASYNEYERLTSIRDRKEIVKVRLEGVSVNLNVNRALLYDVGPMEVFGLERFSCPIRVLVR